MKLYRTIIKIYGPVLRSAYVYIPILTFQFRPISTSALNLTVLPRKSSMRWTLNRKLYGLGEPLKSFASLFLFIMSKVKFLELFQVLVMFIHWIRLSLIVKQYEILKDHFFSNLNINSSSHFEFDMWTFLVLKKLLGRRMTRLPTVLPPSSYALGPLSVLKLSPGASCVFL